MDSNRFFERDCLISEKTLLVKQTKLPWSPSQGDIVIVTLRVSVLVELDCEICTQERLA